MNKYKDNYTSPTEIWRPITSNENLEVSNFGRIRKLDPYNLVGFELINPVLGKNGYLIVGLGKKNGSFVNGAVHYLVAEAFVENPGGFTIVKHKSGNVFDNRPENLKWV